MRTLDLSPLFRNAVGFDHLNSLVDAAMRSDHGQVSYPPYNIESVGEDQYRITMAVAGFKQQDIDIISEQNTLRISGKKQADKDRNFLYQGIAARSFERKFQLADHVKVTSATLEDGMLHVALVREIPEAMKPRKIEIKDAINSATIESEVEKVA